MELDHILTVITILTSILMAFFVSKFTFKKQIEKEKHKGFLLCFELIKRYYFQVYKFHEKQSDDNEVSVLAQMKVLEALIQDFTNLSTNPIYYDIMRKNQYISLLIVSLNIEWASAKVKKKLTFTHGTISILGKIFCSIEKKLDNYFIDDSEYSELKTHLEEFFAKNS